MSSRVRGFDAPLHKKRWCLKQEAAIYFIDFEKVKVGRVGEKVENYEN